MWRAGIAGQEAADVGSSQVKLGLRAKAETLACGTQPDEHVAITHQVGCG